MQRLSAGLPNPDSSSVVPNLYFLLFTTLPVCQLSLLGVDIWADPVCLSCGRAYSGLSWMALRMLLSLSTEQPPYFKAQQGVIFISKQMQTHCWDSEESWTIVVLLTMTINCSSPE